MIYLNCLNYLIYLIHYFIWIISQALHYSQYFTYSTSLKLLYFNYFIWTTLLELLQMNQFTLIVSLNYLISTTSFELLHMLCFTWTTSPKLLLENYFMWTTQIEGFTPTHQSRSSSISIDQGSPHFLSLPKLTMNRNVTWLLWWRREPLNNKELVPLGWRGWLKVGNININHV